MNVQVILWNRIFILQWTAQTNKFNQDPVPQKVQSRQGMCVYMLYYVCLCARKCVFRPMKSIHVHVCYAIYT